MLKFLYVTNKENPALQVEDNLHVSENEISGIKGPKESQNCLSRKTL